MKKISDDYLTLTETILYLIIGTNKPQKTSWTLIKCFLRFFILGNTRRTKLIFFIGMFAFLSFFSTFYQVFENWPFYMHQFCFNTLWSVIKLLWMSAKLSFRRKNCKSVFFTGKVTFLFESFCFQHLRSFCRIDLVTCTTLVWIFFGPMELLPDVAILSITKKTGENHREVAFFLHNISIGFICPIETKLYNAEKMSRNIMGGYKLFTEVFNTP